MEFIERNSLLIIYLTAVIWFFVGKYTTEPEEIYIVKEADKVKIEYQYDYSRLTPSKCVTDWECHTASILEQYNTGKLISVAEQTYTSEPIIEPVTCEPYMSQAECDEQNLNVGLVAHSIKGAVDKGASR